MPYDSVAELPAYVRKMPAEKQRQWMAVFNSAMKDGDSEATAFKKANGVVRASEPERGTPEWFHKMLKADLQQAAEPEHQGNFIGIWLDGSTAGNLAVDGGEPPEELHITLIYDPDGSAENLPAILAAVTRVALEWEELEGTINGRGRFYGDGQDVIYAAPDVPGLSALRQAIADATGLSDTEHGWTPHITLQYIDPGEPTPFAEPQQFMAQGQARDAMGKWTKGGGGLTDSEKDAYGAYAGTLYAPMNAYLRHGKEPLGKAEIEATIAALDSAIAKGSLPVAAKVYRGGDIGSVKVGQVITDKGFVSATLDRVIGERYAARSNAPLIEMHLPKGAKALSVGDTFGKGFDSEREITLPRGSQFRVASVGATIVLEAI